MNINDYKDEIQEVETACENNFAGWLLSNGHAHTMKAYSEFIEWSGSVRGGVENQIDYLAYTLEKENTSIAEILSADDVEEAIDIEILDEDGMYI